MSIDSMSRQDLQIMLDNSRVKARNELQIILNQTRDRLLTQMNTYRQMDGQLVKQCIVVAEQAVYQVGVLEARTVALDKELKALRASLESFANEHRTTHRELIATTEAIGTTQPLQQWQYAAAT